MISIPCSSTVLILLSTSPTCSCATEILTYLFTNLCTTLSNSVYIIIRHKIQPTILYNFIAIFKLGATLIKFLLYLAKIQLTLPRGKKTIKGRTIKYRTTTDTSPLGTLLIAKTPVSYIQIMPLRCRNYPSTSCHLYNWAIQTQGDICSACDCIP